MKNYMQNEPDFLTTYFAQWCIKIFYNNVLPAMKENIFIHIYSDYLVLLFCFLNFK